MLQEDRVRYSQGHSSEKLISPGAHPHRNKMQYQSLAIPPPARHSASSNTSDSGASRKSPELRNENPRRHVGAHSSEVSSLSQDGSLAQLYSRPESGDSYLHDRVMDHLSNDTSNGQLATQTTPSERSPRWSRDPEKGMSSESPRQPHHTSPSTEQLGMADDEDNGNIEEKVETDRHPVWVLFYLSCLSPLFALGISLYTLVGTLSILIASPVYFCAAGHRLRQHLCNLHSPPLRRQLRFIYAPVSDEAPGNTAMLILVNFAGPMYASAIALCTWVAALFWLYANILGDPTDGSEQSDRKDDGKAAVAGVASWWERWLRRGLR